MRYGSVCSGVEAATLAWRPFGWEAAFFSEIEPFPAAVLAHHYPEVPNLGDMNQINGENYIEKIDLLTGGTPCQSFSFAGLRKGLEDPRGNLCLKFAELAHRSRVRWLLWENVPGVLSSNGGRDFAGLLSLLCGWSVEVPVVDRKGSRKWRNSGIITPGPDGFGLAWRVLDAQFVRVDGYPRALPQRRRRVFLVGYRGDWRAAAAVLFDRSSLSGNSQPVRTARSGIARTLTASTGGASAKEQQYNFLDGSGKPLNALGCSWWNGEKFAETLTCTSNGQRMPDKGRFQAMIFDARGNGNGATANTVTGDHAARVNDYMPLVCQSERCPQEVRAGGPMFCGFDSGTYNCACNLCGTMCTQGKATIAERTSVRRLLPVECERLMGFPDDYTRIPWRKKPAGECPDGPRYKVCGNSQCVNVMRWIGQRIDHIDKRWKAK